MTNTHHYNIVQSIFTAPTTLCALPVHLPHSQPLATAALLTVSVVLPFPECHVLGIIVPVAFSDWLLSLTNMHFRFLPIFSWLDSSFFSVDIF